MHHGDVNIANTVTKTITTILGWEQKCKKKTYQNWPLLEAGKAQKIQWSVAYLLFVHHKKTDFFLQENKYVTRGNKWTNDTQQQGTEKQNEKSKIFLGTIGGRRNKIHVCFSIKLQRESAIPVKESSWLTEGCLRNGEIVKKTAPSRKRAKSLFRTGKQIPCLFQGETF